MDDATRKRLEDLVLSCHWNIVEDGFDEKAGHIFMEANVTKLVDAIEDYADAAHTRGVAEANGRGREPTKEEGERLHRRGWIDKHLGFWLGADGNKYQTEEALWIEDYADARVKEALNQHGVRGMLDFTDAKDSPARVTIARNQALEDAAKVADDAETVARMSDNPLVTAHRIAEAIRKLKTEKPNG